MQHLLRYSILVATVIIVCLLSLFPLEENLRLGKDLAGGVSLVYTIEVRPDDPPDVVDRTIAVLKDRVNPRGLYEISFQQIGRDRIEISMPLPNERVRRLRAEYEQTLRTIDAFGVDNDAFQRVLRLRGEERDRALAAMMDTEPRRALLAPVAEAIRRAEEARAAYEAARDAGPAGPGLDALLDAAADAEVALEEARDRVLRSHVDADQMRTILELPSRPHRVRSRSGVVELPSPRDEALAGLRERIAHLPGSTETIDRIVEVHTVYASQRRGFDDPNELIRLLRGSGVLEFRIAVTPGERPDEERLRAELRERGATNVQVDGAGWFPINDLKNWYDTVENLQALRDNPASYFAGRYGLVAEGREGRYFILLHDSPGMRMTRAEGEWALDGAFITSDELGRPAVGFRMNPRGGVLLGQLTEAHQGRQMAIVLDDQVISAPNLNSRITTNGIIQGSFSQEELAYLIKTMAAGSLQARLGERPISQSTLAPELGADNLQSGLRAAWISLIAIGIFMVAYYFFSGAVAMVTLVVNAIIILGIMSLNRAAFTLPGIAGVILTFGTAVDANVLIYERIREELLAGNDVRTSVRMAFKRVATTIIDANLTNLIVCIVLVYMGTQEIKGFGITMGIGVISTIFCSIIVTRLIYVFMAERLKAGPWVVSQLPVVWPLLQRLLTPRIRWMRLFPLFAVISTVLMGMGLFFIYYEGEKLLDTEFRGGTSITMQLKSEAGPAGRTQMRLTRAEVDERIKRVSAEAEREGRRELFDLRNAEIVPINPEADGVTSDRFIIRTTILDENLLKEAIADGFGDVVESRPAIEFDGSHIEDINAAPVYGIVDSALGVNFGRPDITNDVNEYLGGAVVLLDNIDPPSRRDLLVARLEYMRSSPAFSTDALRRDHVFIVIEGTDDEVRSAAVVVRDGRFSVYEDEAKWRQGLARQEWEIVREALTQPTVLANFNSFAPAIAQTFRAQAILAVLLSFILISIYVWVRFGSVRYSLAAVVPLVHDTIIAVGLVALAEIIYERVPGAAALGIRPIKIDLGLVAAVMTIIGYSLNDTIVILDRIRENRGKLAYASAEVIDNSVNQTMSRTLITAGTSLISLLILFFLGGEAISSFAYTMICGLIIGTYSSVAIAAPIVYQRHAPAAAHYTPDPDARPGDEEERRTLPSSAGL